MHFFGKTIKNARKHTGIKLVIIEKKKKLLDMRTKLSHKKVFHKKNVVYRHEKK